MRKLRCFLLWLVFVMSLTTLQAQAINPFQVEITVESAFTRVVPSPEATRASSVFIGDRLIAIGRNADGSWLEVQRPGIGTKIGWITREFLDYEFDVAALPLTDGVTGLTGTTPVVDEYGVSIYTQYEATLRSEPNVRSAAITIVPFNLVLPALERYPDQTWVKVNYRGNVGWIAGFLVTYPANIKDLPVTPGVEGIGGFVIEIIPPEVQYAQVQRLREFVTYRRDLAANLAGFWAVVKRGEIVPCEPPGFIREEYEANFQDYKELPELRRYLPRLNVGIDHLNYSIETLQPCGVYTAAEVDKAYANAVNARIIFDVNLDQLDNLEENIIPK